MKRILVFVIALIAAVMWYAGTPSVAQNFQGRIIANQSGKCVDVFRGDRDAAIIIFDCNGGSNQNWVFQNGILKSVGTGQCVYRNGDVTDWPHEASRRAPSDFFPALVTRDCVNPRVTKYGADRSQVRPVSWRIDGARLIGRDICMDVSGGQTRNGSSLLMWNCNGGANQNFSFGR
jgi:hypothetical protein